jgi:hypothetical protein
MKLGAKWQFCSKTCHCSLPESVDQLPVCLPKSHIYRWIFTVFMSV